MKYIFNLLVLVFSVLNVYGNGQVCHFQIIGNKLASIDSTKFNSFDFTDIIDDADFFKNKKFAQGEAMEVYLKKWAELVDETNGFLDEGALSGLTKTLSCLVNKDGIDVTEYLRKTCVINGQVDGSKMNLLLNKLNSSSKFDFIPDTKTFKSKSTGLEYSFDANSNPQKHGVTHIVQGHTKNDFTTKPSLFDSADEVFDLIDEAFNKFKAQFDNIPVGDPLRLEQITDSTVRWKKQFDNRYRIEVDLNKKIGISGSTPTDANFIRVIVSEDLRKVSTSFPQVGFAL